MTKPDEDDAFDRAVEHLGIRRTFRSAEHVIELAVLSRTRDWRPLRAQWWRGKEVCVIGADLDGNFLLRHCDGSVRYWQHQLQADLVIAKRVREFASRISE